MKQHYQEYLKLNKNIFFGFMASVIISALAAQLFFAKEHYVNATLTLFVDYFVYLSTFGSLYYFDNRQKYKITSDEINWQLLKKDLTKLITSLGIGEIVYVVMRWIIQYYLLTIYEPYIASLISQSISFVIFLFVVNVFAKIIGLYKNDT